MQPSWDERVQAEIQDVDFERFDYTVELDTTSGLIRLRLFPDAAPVHCLNFIGLARSGFYDGLVFHRVIDGFVIQAGCPHGDGTGGPGYRVPAEFNDRPHEPGTLSMARASDPNSAGSQFFICLERIPHLDRQYTVFGQTADEESLEVVKRIGAVETDKNDRPLRNVKINKARVVATPKNTQTA